MHAAIADALPELGIHGRPARRIGRIGQIATKNDRLLCFTDPDPEDIVTKASRSSAAHSAGAAGAVLQHGSVLLARSSRTPELPGVCDVADDPRGTDDWSDRLARSEFPTPWDLRPVDVGVPAEVAARAAELEAVALPQSRLDRTALVTRRVRVVVVLTSMPKTESRVACILAQRRRRISGIRRRTGAPRWS